MAWHDRLKPKGGPSRKPGQQDDRPTAQMAQDERLIDRVEFRVTALDWRRMMLLFQNNKKQFGWSLHTDLFRYLIKRGLADTEKDAKNPTDEMQDAEHMSEVIEMAARQTGRHARLDVMLQSTAVSVQSMFDLGDLGAVRTTLEKLRKEINGLKDHTIRYKAGQEFDRRWGNLWESINRHAKLPTGDEDEPEDD